MLQLGVGKTCKAWQNTEVFYMRAGIHISPKPLTKKQSYYTWAFFSLCRKNVIDPEDPRCARLTLTGQMVTVPPEEVEFAKQAMFSRSVCNEHVAECNPQAWDKYTDVAAWYGKIWEVISLWSLLWGHEACWLLCGLEGQAELCNPLLTLQVTKYGNAISQCWALVKHMIYNLGIRKIFHLALRRHSINPGCIFYLE